MGANNTNTVWEEIPELRKRLDKELRLNEILKTRSAKTFYDEVMEVFGAAMKASHSSLSFDEFVAEAKDILWTPKIEDLLRKWLRHSIDHKKDVEKWQSNFPYIPLEWAYEKARWLTGVSNETAPAPMLFGMGLLGDEHSLKGIEDVPLPKSSFKKPYHIPVPSRTKWSWAVFNGANLGLTHNRVIEENPLRRKLAEAERNHLDVVILTNVIDVEVIKAQGPLLIYRSHIAGQNTKISILDPGYQAEARWIEKDLPSDEVIYETPNEILLNILSGLRKVMFRPDKTPEFSGKMYYILCYREEQLISTAAYWWLHKITRRKQNRLDAEIRMIAKALDRAHRDKDEATIATKKAEHDRVSSLRARTMISNIRREDRLRFEQKMRSFFIKSLKEAVPNIEVIGEGSMHIEMGGEKIEIHIPHDLRVTDSFLANYALNMGPKILRREAPERTIICAPYALQYRDTTREADEHGKRRSVQVFVAPIMVDDRFLRDELSNSVRQVHPIQRAVFSEQFKPGVICFRHNNGVSSADEWPIVNFTPPHMKRAKKVPEYKDFNNAKYIWLMTATDQHWGSRTKEFVWCEERRASLGMFEAVAHRMREDRLLTGKKFPIHLFSSNDDPTQGNHYRTELQPHPHQMSYKEMEDRTRDTWFKAQNATGAEKLALFNEYQKLVMYQLRVRGADWPQHQLEDLMERHIEPNVDFFSAVLTRATESGLILRGVSELTGQLHDGRDMGIINEGTGNHFQSTVEKMMTEGFLYCAALKYQLLGLPKWRGKNDLLTRLVKAPLYSNEFVGWGTIQHPDGYEWGIDLRSSPTRMASWGDTLLGSMRNDRTRGNPSRIFDGKMRLTTFGDKHFFGNATTPYAIYHMCAAGTQTDLYGERGFPPNNTGVSFIGLPADGPSMPILRRMLPYDQIATLIASRKRFDWEEFLPNPV